VYFERSSGVSVVPSLLWIFTSCHDVPVSPTVVDWKACVRAVKTPTVDLFDCADAVVPIADNSDATVIATRNLVRPHWNDIRTSVVTNERADGKSRDRFVEQQKGTARTNK
jgi:hypothetical protein